MANAEQLEILKQGVEVWNKWRAENPAADVDLTGADLRGAALKGAALWAADLSEANASEVDLAGANLYKANLSRADLSKADLREAKLEAADLSGADLSEAALWGADLRQADLRMANLRQANLTQADFGNSMLNGANLSKAELSEADLHTAYLWKADLSEATLWEANLRGAYLPQANLREATIGQVDLSEADLREADLRGAELLVANLRGADLREADLTGARLLATIFAGVDLSRTKGLDEVDHIGPSTIGTDTMQLTRARLPEAFLRGCGLSDLDIAYSKLADPRIGYEYVEEVTDSICRLHASGSTQHSPCFISYSSEDHQFVEFLHADLQASGVRCWSPPSNMKIYSLVNSTIHHQMEQGTKLLIVLSENSVKRKEFEFEVEHALRAEEQSGRPVLVPIRLDRGVMTTGDEWAAKVRRRRIGDFSKWQDKDCYRQAFDSLLRELEAA